MFGHVMIEIAGRQLLDRHATIARRKAAASEAQRAFISLKDRLAFIADHCDRAVTWQVAFEAAPSVPWHKATARQHDDHASAIRLLADAARTQIGSLGVAHCVAPSISSMSCSACSRVRTICPSGLPDCGSR